MGLELGDELRSVWGLFSPLIFRMSLCFFVLGGKFCGVGLLFLNFFFKGKHLLSLLV